MTWHSDLAALDPCPDALEWARTYDDPQRAWNECERGDWMLWWLGHHAGPPGSDARRPLVLAACECARLAWDLMTEADRRAIETAEAWARREGGVTLEDVRQAAGVADAPAWSAACVAPAAGAVWVARAAAKTVDAAAAAAAKTVDAAAAAAAKTAVDATTAAAAREATLSRCAAIVREHFPSPPVRRAGEGA